MALGGPFRAAERAMLCRAPKAPAQAGRVSVTSLSPLLSRARLRLLPGCVAAPPSRRRRLSPSARAQSAVRGPSGTARSQADPRPGFARRRRAGLHWAEHGPPGPSSDRDSERLQCASPGLSDSERLQCASTGLSHALSCGPPPPPSTPSSLRVASRVPEQRTAEPTSRDLGGRTPKAPNTRSV